MHANDTAARANDADAGALRLEALIAEVQRLLGVQEDGRPGPKTWAAIHAALHAASDAAARAAGADPHAAERLLAPVDARSERVIADLEPPVQAAARALVHKAAGIGIEVKIINGLRTYAEQDTLYAHGRSKPGTIITDARAGYSNHNFGIAFDVGVFDGKEFIGACSRYKAVAALALDLGLEWGGSWDSPAEEPHFQLRPRWAVGMSEADMLAELREREADGRPFYD